MSDPKQWPCDVRVPAEREQPIEPPPNRWSEIWELVTLLAFVCFLILASAWAFED